MSSQSIADFKFTDSYAKYLPNAKRRETRKEAINRSRLMYQQYYHGQNINSFINEAFDTVEEGLALQSMRAMQFAGPAVLQHHARQYNCWASYADRLRFFQEAFYILLCGGGIGYSVQFHHVETLPEFHPSDREHLPVKEHIIEDSIEGWSDALGVLLSSYFQNPVFAEYAGCNVWFRYDKIRPKGSPFSHGVGTAPGPDGLRSSLEKIRTLLDNLVRKGQSRLRPIDAYDIVCHAADAVLSGGVRRSASICCFSFNDEEMMRAKTGHWWSDNPQRARSNNSAVLVRDQVTFEQFKKFEEWTKQYGEPGFLWVDHPDWITNPCVEILMYCYDNEGRSGWQACNLTTQNCAAIQNIEQWRRSAKAAATLGTLQAGLTSFPYLGPITESIVRREALIGVSMTGMMLNPKLFFNPEHQQEIAKLVLQTNAEIANKININTAARTTCIKPEGSTSIILGNPGYSGCHPGKGKRVLRRIQINKDSPVAQLYKSINPESVEESVHSANGTDYVVTFPYAATSDAITENDLRAVEFLEFVKSTQINYVQAGTRPHRCVMPNMHHNVSNTVMVDEDEWGDVMEFIYSNREFFCGVSLLAKNGDKAFDQPPFSVVKSPKELEQEYGPSYIFVSGIIHDAISTFGRLHNAYAVLMGYGEMIDVAQLRAYINDIYAQENKIEIERWEERGIVLTSHNNTLMKYLDKTVDNLDVKLAWLNKSKRFANRYLKGNMQKLAALMKDVDNLKSFVDLTDSIRPVDYTKMHEEHNNTRPAEEIACAGGACSV